MVGVAKRRMGQGVDLLFDSECLPGSPRTITRSHITSKWSGECNSTTPSRRRILEYFKKVVAIIIEDIKICVH